MCLDMMLKVDEEVTKLPTDAERFSSPELLSFVMQGLRLRVFCYFLY